MTTIDTFSDDRYAAKWRGRHLSGVSGVIQETPARLSPGCRPSRRWVLAWPTHQVVGPVIVERRRLCKSILKDTLGQTAISAPRELQTRVPAECVPGPMGANRGAIRKRESIRRTTLISQFRWYGPPEFRWKGVAGQQVQGSSRGPAGTALPQ